MRRSPPTSVPQRPRRPVTPAHVRYNYRYSPNGRIRAQVVSISKRAKAGAVLQSEMGSLHEYALDEVFGPDVRVMLSCPCRQRTARGLRMACGLTAAPQLRPAVLAGGGVPPHHGGPHSRRAQRHQHHGVRVRRHGGGQDAHHHRLRGAAGHHPALPHRPLPPPRAQEGAGRAPPSPPWARAG